MLADRNGLVAMDESSQFVGLVTWVSPARLLDLLDQGQPVGKPDAGNRLVRFDERGWETGRAHRRPFSRPSSTLPAVSRLVSTHVRGCDLVSKAGVGRSADAAVTSAYATLG